MDPPVNGINSMDPPASGDEIKPKKLEEAKEAGPLFHCDLSDSEVVYKIAQALLPGLASACVDNTTGALLRSYASVAVNIRRDMVDYLVQRSESFVAESVVLEGGTHGDVSDNPFDVISNFIDDFAASKRNFLSKVSGWLLSDRREDRIDDFLQQMELNGFWLIGRRESVAHTLLKNVDIKNAFHCNMKFKESKELDEHRFHCSFRSIICTNEGCDARFSACHLEQHESACPFEIIPCEQKCPESIIRREMDKHCITVCTMKLVNCPLYQFGCHSTIPQCKIDEHLISNLQPHILEVLRISHKGFSEDSLKKRLGEIEKISSLDNLASLRDARSLTNAVKNYEMKLGSIEEIKVEPESNVNEGQLKENQGMTSSSSSEDNLELTQNNEKVLASTITNPEPKESQEKKDLEGSTVSIREIINDPSLQEENPDESPKEKKRHENSSPRKEENVVIESPIELAKNVHNLMEEDEQSTSSSNDIVESHTKIEKHSESSDESEEHEKLATKKYDKDDSLFKRHVLEDSLVNVNENELDQDAKFQKSTTQAPKPIDDFVEKRRRSTSSSDKSTSPAKRDVMDGQSKKNEGKISSSSSEDNMEIPHNIGKVLESTITKPEPKESPVEKDLVGSPAFIKEIINEIVESPAKREKLSESSDESEEHEKSPTKIYDQADSPIKRHVLEDSPVNINEHELDLDAKFQKYVTEATEEGDDFIEKLKQSTSSSDKSTSPVKGDKMVKSPTSSSDEYSTPLIRDKIVGPPPLIKKISESSDESEEHEMLNTNKHDKEDSPLRRYELENDIVKMNEQSADHSTEKHRESTSSSDKFTTPIKRDEMVGPPTHIKKLSESSDESEEHEESLLTKHDQEDSPFKRHELEDSLGNINEQELNKDEKFKQDVTETKNHVDRSAEKHRQSISSSDKSISPVKRGEIGSPTQIGKLSKSSSDSEEHETSPTKKYGQEDSSSRRDLLKDSLIKTIKLADSPIKSNVNESSSDESDEQEKSPTKKYDQEDSPFERHELKDSLVKINKKEDSPVKSNAHESSSDESKEYEKSLINKYDQEHSPSKIYDLEDSIVNIIKLEDSHVKSDAHESSSDENVEEEN